MILIVALGQQRRHPAKNHYYQPSAQRPIRVAIAANHRPPLVWSLHYRRRKTYGRIIMETMTSYGNNQPAEDSLTKGIERYTAYVPSTGYLGIALGAMALSLACQLAGQGKWGNFIAQWVPTWLIIGLYNKVVKLEGHDASDHY
jgi:hypothetical protein